MEKREGVAVTGVNDKRPCAVKDRVRGRGRAITLLSLRDGGNQGGFTLIEFLIAIAVSMIVAAGIYGIYSTFFKQTRVQDMVLEAQQNARAAINLIEREVVNAGYAAGTVDIITIANPNEIEFIYVDPATDAALSITSGHLLKVKYSIADVNGVQSLIRTVNDQTVGTTTSEQVIPHVQSLAILYFKIDGTSADTAAQPDRNEIRFASFTLVTETSDVHPDTLTKKTFMVRTHLRIRNIGIGHTSLDSTPPTVPTDVEVRDPRLCGRLKVKWTESPEGDVAGYDLFYGTASGSENYTGIINISAAVLSGPGYDCDRIDGSPPSLECTITPSAPALAFTPSDLSTTITHYIAVQAYDASLNHTGYSAEVSGDPDPSNSVFGSGSHDSTINPVKPATAVTGFTGADGAGEGEVYLSWDAYDTAASPDVVGFRIYRSEQPFTSYPIKAGVDIKRVAEEFGGSPLNENATSFTDNSADLLGCTLYYYAIAPVNCDGTLVSDAGGDPDEHKYLAADYAEAYGDGSEDEADSPNAGVTDTAPAETTPTTAPTIDARAGWKRVAVSLTQPGELDLAQTCLYADEGSTYPELLTTKDALECLEVDTVISPTATLIPDSGGVFTVAELAPSTSTSFWHDSMTVEDPPVPVLDDFGTYSYRAVSFDRCGNASNITGAQATTTLCGEDPADPATKPPAVTDLVASCCDTPVTLTWTGISSNLALPSSYSNPYDLAGYRIFRSTSAVDFSASTMISGPAPFWGTSFNDTAGLVNGGTYYYRVVTTDCPYEKGDDTGGTAPTVAQIRTHMISGFLDSVMVGPVNPGILDRDEKCPVAGGCTKDLHREVITGVSIDNTSGTGTGSTTPETDFDHDKVTLFFDNVSAGDMTIQGADLLWVNSGANLKKVDIGGGRSGVGETSTSISAPPTPISGNPPYTVGHTGFNLTDAPIPGASRYVPITFTFEDSGGDPVDMREDQLLITLYVKNDSTGTTMCESYLTVSQSLEGVAVPFGPSVTATQQNRPVSPTFGFAVPGATGLNTVPSGSDGTVVAGATVSVTVSANVQSNTTNAETGSKVAISSAKLYYNDTANTVTTAPTSGFTEVPMVNSGGNIWNGVIPSLDGRRVWYYIVAIDEDGNYDRDPEVDAGAYVYDQKIFDVCDVTPSAITDLSASASGSDVLLSWTAPTTYTSGATVDAGDALSYQIIRNGSEIVASQPATTYSDLSLIDGVYSYSVRALNSCAVPGPNTSARSNAAASCVGTTGQATIDVTPTTILQGDTYTVSILDCLAASGANSTTVQKLNVDVGFTPFSNTSLWPETFTPVVTESGPATGIFNVTIRTADNDMETGKLPVLTSDTITVNYPFASPPTKVVKVIPDPCDSTPSAPTGLTGSVIGQNMTLTWNAVTDNIDASPIIDLAGYRVYEKVCDKDKPDCTGSDIVADWFLRNSVGAATTSTTLGADHGTVGKRIYYFKVTAIDTCGSPNESADSNLWNE